MSLTVTNHMLILKSESSIKLKFQKLESERIQPSRLPH